MSNTINRTNLIFDSYADGDITSETAKQQLQALILKERKEEVSAIAPDMRTHPEYKGYVETSISGNWRPLSERIKELDTQIQQLK